MKGKSRGWWEALVAIVIVFIIVSVIKYFVDMIYEGNVTGDGTVTSKSIESSRHRGILITEFDANPSSFLVDGKPVTITQAWLEERSDPAKFLAWIPYERRTGDFQLCFLAHDDGKQSTLYFFTGFSAKVGRTNVMKVKDRNLAKWEFKEAYRDKINRFPIEVVLKRKS